LLGIRYPYVSAPGAGGTAISWAGCPCHKGPGAPRRSSRKRASGSGCASKLAHQEKAVALLPHSKSGRAATAVHQNGHPGRGGVMGGMPMPHGRRAARFRLRQPRRGPCGPGRSLGFCPRRQAGGRPAPVDFSHGNCCPLATRAFLPAQKTADRRSEVVSGDRRGGTALR